MKFVFKPHFNLAGFWRALIIQYFCKRFVKATNFYYMENEQLRGRRKFLVIILLGLLSAIGPFSIDMYLPGFQDIATDLNTSIERIQLSLSSFFVGIAAGQLFYGPLLDRFGRKPPLIVGLLIYLASSLACAFATSADSLIALRFLQALGSCGGMVAARAMVRDFFPASETAKVFSLLMLVIGISPILAPTLGGYFIAHLGWQSIFIFLSVFVVLILFGVTIFLKGAKTANKELSLRPKLILKNYREVLRLPQFYIYALSGGFASSGLYAYISGSPFVMMNLFGLSEKQYGWAFAGLAMSLITGSQLNNILLRRYSSQTISKYALMVQAIMGTVLVILSFTNQLTLISLLSCTFFYLGSQGFVFPNTSALALNPFTKLAGSASAMLGTIQLSIGALASAYVSFFHNNTAIPMVVIMALCSLLSFLFMVILAPRSRKNYNSDVKV